MSKPLTRYQLELEDGSTALTASAATRAPKWIAYANRYENHVKPTGRIFHGLGREVVDDLSRPPMVTRISYAFDLRRHAKEACQNERWAVRLLDSDFHRSELSERHVLRVVSATKIEGMQPRWRLLRATFRTTADVERAVERTSR